MHLVGSVSIRDTEGGRPGGRPSLTAPFIHHRMAKHLHTAKHSSQSLDDQAWKSLLHERYTCRVPFDPRPTEQDGHTQQRHFKSVGVDHVSWFPFSLDLLPFLSLSALAPLPTFVIVAREIAEVIPNL